MLLLLIACVADVPVSESFSAAGGDVERGRYLGEHVANCLMCHSERDWSHFGAPNTDGALGAGHDSTQRIEPFPEGTVLWTRNITSDRETGLGSWTDGEIARAVTAGLSRDGTPLFLNMPYDQFGALSAADLTDLVAWVRSIPPVTRQIPERVLPFPLGIAVRTMPRAPAPVAETPTAGVERGAYLANLASCIWCHSPVDSNQVVIPGSELSGGHTWTMPGGGVVASANLTPAASGLGAWTREGFIARFKAINAEAMHAVEVKPGGFATPMPWVPFSGMTEADLGYIWDYLAAQQPIENTVTKWQAPG